MSHLMNRQRIALLSMFVTLTLTYLPMHVTAQSTSSAFTVEDMLDVENVYISDLSNDGIWLAATSASLRDRIGFDNHRFGDPTYLVYALADVWIINTPIDPAPIVSGV